jgi:uncharacterized membrane protein YraQ (UPF0718 family)
VLITVLLAVVLLLWSKWLPYGARIGELGATGSYPGSSILGVGGVRPGDAPSWGAGISFTVAYVQAVWKALVAALLISAAIQSLVPRAWLLRLLNRRRRWTGPDPVTTPPVPPDEPADLALAAAPARFGRTLLRLTLVLVPEYLVVVLLIGAFRGWLFPIGGDLFGTGLLAVLVAAVAGTLLVIPTAAEIPILQGLAIAGLAAGPIGALLVTLPAVSVPGMVMVSRAFGRRATGITAAVVAAGGLVGAAVLTVL